MTNRRLWDIALAQSALELGCAPADFSRGEPLVTGSAERPGARRYLEQPLPCHLAYYGGNVVATARDELTDGVESYLRRYAPEHCFETPNLYALDALLAPHGLRACFMAEYFLPDLRRLRALPCELRLRVLTPADFAALYVPAWENALSPRSPERDVLGVGAYDGERLAGLAACSADCDGMWQIGVDVLPAYRRRGVAAALTSRLALEILHAGRAPFYCVAWSNLRSVRNALRSGFVPAWTELTAKPTAFVDALNEAE